MLDTGRLSPGRRLALTVNCQSAVLSVMSQTKFCHTSAFSRSPARPGPTDQTVGTGSTLACSRLTHRDMSHQSWSTFSSRIFHAQLWLIIC
jgi:hypothetical protein